MARKPRVHYPGALYRVILRGHAGQIIFDGDEERTQVTLLAQEVVERFGQRIHAFCPMSNHVHIDIQVGRVSPSQILQSLGSRSTQRSTGARKRTGHLFHGRYKALLVDADSHLHAPPRYSHLNAHLNPFPLLYSLLATHVSIFLQKVVIALSELGNHLESP
jgi:putative transposase